MISKEMEQAFNEQLNKELYSAYLYLAMSAYCAAEGFPGFSHWMRLQYEEEMMHAMKLYDYILERDGSVQLQQIDQPPREFGSPVEVFEKTLAHEQFITQSINDLIALAVDERDFASQAFLQWFVTEQVEEEANVKDILAPLRMIGKEGGGLMMIDQKLARRAAPAPVDTNN